MSGDVPIGIFMVLVAVACAIFAYVAYEIGKSGK